MRVPHAYLLIVLLLLPLGCGENRSPGVEDAEQTVAGPAYASDGTLVRDVERPSRLPNLIVIVIDALRADAMGGDDGGRPRMPFLSSLASRGVRFENAVAPSPWTLPSMVSLFTGLLPSIHGQVHPDGGWTFPDTVTTLPEVLSRGYGYATAAFLNGDWFRLSGEQLLQGFEQRRTVFALQGLRTDVGRWNETRDRRRPFFLLLHTYEAHDPYGEKNHPWPPYYDVEPALDPELLAPDIEPAEIFRRCFLDADAGHALGRHMGIRLRDLLQRYKYQGYAEDPRPELAAELRDAYVNGVRWVDGLLEKAYRQLQAMGLLQNTLLVVTADHGEAFGEHGNLAHGLWLYDELVRIPLVMIGPPPFKGGRVVEQSVGLVDVLPTFLDWSGMAPLANVDGHSAMGTLEGGDWCRPVVSEEPLTRANTGEPVSAVRISARTPNWKYIVTLDLLTWNAREEAYDLLVDPWERDDLAEGTGRLPDYLLFDECMCAAVEAVRGRVWPEAEVNEEDPAAVYTTPYGTGTQRSPGKRPTPCRSKQ